MILKISRLNKIISIRVCLLVKPAAQMFVKIDLIRENSRNHPVLSPLLQWIDKWLPKTDHRQPITIPLSLSFRLSHRSQREQRSVLWCGQLLETIREDFQFRQTFAHFYSSLEKLRGFAKFFEPVKFKRQIPSLSRRMEGKGTESKRDHFFPLNSNRFLSIFIIAILYPPIYSP